MKKKLTPKQEMFVKEYLVDLNATRAAIRAGYSEKTADRIGPKLLGNIGVSRAIGEAMKKRAEKVELSADFVVRGLIEVSRRCLQQVPVLEFDRAERRMVQAKDEEGRDMWTFDSTGANRAFELLGKHIGLFTDKIQHSGDLNLSGVLRVPVFTPDEWQKMANGGKSE